MHKILALATLCLLGSQPGHAATLTGSPDSSFTRIISGELVYEFLDLNLTTGMDPNTALRNYGSGSSKYRIANQDDVSILFEAFGFNYDFSQPVGFTGSFINDIDGAEQDNFIRYMGYDAIGSGGNRYALGNFLNNGSYNYFCITETGGNGECTPAFLRNTRNLNGSMVMVRTSAVPVPAAGWLLISGLGAIFIKRRRSA